MKKLLALLCVAFIIVGFSGCGQKEEVSSSKDKNNVEEKPNVEAKDENKEEAKDDTKKEDEKISIPKEPIKTPSQLESKKALYIEKINQVQLGLADLASYYAGITLEQNYAAGEEYSRWDKLLNEIYGVLKEQMKAEDFKKLESEQIKWINDKDPKAKESAKKYEGGTQYEVEYAMTLSQLTKERCNYLVNNYMK